MINHLTCTIVGAQALAGQVVKAKSGEPKIWFTSMRSLAEVLSDENRALLQLIKKTNPLSIKSLAETTGRKPGDLSRTHEDHVELRYRRNEARAKPRPSCRQGNRIQDCLFKINSL